MESGRVGLRILNGAGSKLKRYNDQNREVRKYYLDVLKARGPSKSLVSTTGDVNSRCLVKVEEALRYYLGMARGGKMEPNVGGSFIERLNKKIIVDGIKVSLIKLRDVDILSLTLDVYKQDARNLYECLSAPGKDGLSADGSKFCVGATKIMHLFFPELFVMLDKVMAESLCKNGYRGKNRGYNNFNTFWDEAMQACHDELLSWRKKYGDTNSLLILDTEVPKTLVRIFDKCRRY